MSCIRLNPSVSVTPTRVGVFLRSDLDALELSGSHASVFIQKIVSLLDGSRDREAILEALGEYSHSSVAALLDLLGQRGLLDSACDAPAPKRRRAQEEFFRKWMGDPDLSASMLREARVLFVGHEPWSATAAAELAAAGVGRIHGPLSASEAEDSMAAGGPWSLVVAAAAPEDVEEVARIARAAHRAKIVSLWSHLAGTTAILGPLVEPGKTACRVCASAEALNPSIGGRESVRSTQKTRSMEQLLGGLVALEALKVLSGYTFSALGGRLFAQDLAGFDSSFYTLVRIPWCRVCGEG